MANKTALGHTKGPWNYQEVSDAYTHIVRGPNGEFILSAPQGTSGEDEANTRLAAAAPELLEALKVIADRLTVGPRHSGHLKSVQAIQAVAKAAIAKAEATDAH
jgi:hypothetical protein